MNKKQNALVPPRKRRKIQTAIRKNRKGDGFKQKKPVVEVKPTAEEKKQNANKRLFDCAKKADIEGVRKALDDGADVNTKDEKGRNVIMYCLPYYEEDWARDGATVRRHDAWEEIITLAIKKGINVNAKDDGQRTALMYAAKSFSTGVFEKLIKTGADIRAKNKYGMDAFSYSVTGDGRHKAEKLIELGIDVNQTYSFNEITPLLLAAAYGSSAGIAFLLDHGANINAKDNKGRDALFYAGKCKENWKKEGVIKLLKARGIGGQ